MSKSPFNNTPREQLGKPKLQIKNKHDVLTTLSKYGPRDKLAREDQKTHIRLK